MSVKHVHLPLNQEVRAIGGSYILAKEARLPLQGRELLYVVGYAAIDSACCGPGGCAYALVPGFIVEWKSALNPAGGPVSLVEPVQDPAVQDQIRRLLMKRETVQQVSFL